VPSPFRDKTGMQFGFWTVLAFAGRDNRNATQWKCRCICGTEKVVVVGSLTKGRSKSCGCKAIELRGNFHWKHGYASTPTYKSWHSMKQRCEGKGGHESYLARGIAVCERWLSFENFLEDMGERPRGKTLDRIDNSKGYEPSNCRWADMEQQANNRDTNILEIVDGEALTPAQAARKYGKNISGIRHRLRKGWSLQEAVHTPRLGRSA
jgi:hypothetical protein